MRRDEAVSLFTRMQWLRGCLHAFCLSPCCFMCIRSALGPYTEGVLPMFGAQFSCVCCKWHLTSEVSQHGSCDCSLNLQLLHQKSNGSLFYTRMQSITQLGKSAFIELTHGQLLLPLSCFCLSSLPRQCVLYVE